MHLIFFWSPNDRNEKAKISFAQYNNWHELFFYIFTEPQFTIHHKAKLHKPNFNYNWALQLKGHPKSFLSRAGIWFSPLGIFQGL